MLSRKDKLISALEYEKSLLYKSMWEYDKSFAPHGYGLCEVFLNDEYGKIAHKSYWICQDRIQEINKLLSTLKDK